MKKLLTGLALAAMATSAMGCSFALRSPDMYRDDTRALLETKSSEIKGCYDALLKGDKSLSGTVRVSFIVEADTGVIMNPVVDPEGTTVPESLSSCVVNAIDGLVLEPPDNSEGQATFTWDFTASGGSA